MESKEIAKGLAIEMDPSNLLSEEEESDQEEKNSRSQKKTMSKTLNHSMDL